MFIWMTKREVLCETHFFRTFRPQKSTMKSNLKPIELWNRPSVNPWVFAAGCLMDGNVMASIWRFDYEKKTFEKWLFWKFLEIQVATKVIFQSKNYITCEKRDHFLWNSSFINNGWGWAVSSRQCSYDG